MIVKDFKHGHSAYNKHHCRCSICKKAKSDYCKTPEYRTSQIRHNHKFYITPKSEKWRLIHRLKNNFGLTLTQYESMLIAQNGHCACCPTTPAENHRKLAVDHDHETGQVRGLLCVKCNQALGMVNESFKTLQNLAGYILGQEGNKTT